MIDTPGARRWTGLSWVASHARYSSLASRTTPGTDVSECRRARAVAIMSWVSSVYRAGLGGSKMPAGPKR